ncbi:MAG: PKD domain-containing protein, partial [Bacteroidetes bacterium]
MIRVSNAKGLRGWTRQLLLTGLVYVLALFSAFSQPNANFTADVTAGCSPFTVHFTDLSSGTIHTWFWDFGNGNTSVFDDVIATYTNPGTYTVSLTVTDTLAGLSSTRTEVAYITVYDDPVADFAPDTTSGCAPLTVLFTDQSTAGSAALTSWAYDFGDGHIGTTANPSHTYTAAGYYTVTQVVTDANGCSDVRVYNDLIHVTEVATVDFTASPQTGCTAPLNVTFTSSVSPAGSYAYLWDFGDGTTSSAPNPSHIYTVTGDYTVTLTVTDPSGCQETVQKDNFVLINTPTADFQALNTTVCTGQPVLFENLSSGADGYIWTFGDGNTSTATHPTHIYNAPGTYPVSLTANNSAGCSDFEGKSGYITVNASPAVSFTADDHNGCSLPFLVNFTDQSIGNIVSWYWDFGNGNFANGQNPSTTYNTPGVYDVSLTVTTNSGCEATATVPNYILVSPPVANFLLGPNQGCMPLTVNFLNLSTSPADPIVGYIWTFGDGAVSAQANPTHTYTVPGQYTVSLTVTTASGCQDTEIYQYVEVGTKPTVDFQGVPRVACVDEAISFTDLTIGGGTEWFWNFGDGGGSNVQHPVYTYQDTGYFPVSLIVSYMGCRDTLQRDSFIHIVGPLADFTMNPAQGCNPPMAVSFFDQSGGANVWSWDFGDGNSSSQENPSHTYVATGTFNVTLVVTDSISGCVNQATQNLVVTDPQAGFTASDTYGCAPLAVNFGNTSVDATNYLWDFGDGTTSTAANPSHTYTSTGTYTVTLIASDGACADTMVQTSYIEVIGGTVDFVVNSTNGCAPLPVHFNDASTPYPGTSIVGWSWQFGDGGTSFAPNPNYTYSNPGSYDVTLTIIDSEGCSASITKANYVNPTYPTAGFVTTDTVACPGAFISFTNQSSGNGLSYLWNFGDGTTGTAPNPTHLYPGNGIYTVS